MASNPIALSQPKEHKPPVKRPASSDKETKPFPRPPTPRPPLPDPKPPTPKETQNEHKPPVKPPGPIGPRPLPPHPPTPEKIAILGPDPTWNYKENRPLRPGDPVFRNHMHNWSLEREKAKVGGAVHVGPIVHRDGVGSFRKTKR